MSTSRVESGTSLGVKCTLCHNRKTEAFFEDSRRQWVYGECMECGLVFRDPQSFLDPGAEKTRYESHNNSIENQGYVKFLSPVVESLAPYIRTGEVGLDFGCGPGPILDQLLRPLGVSVENYDPYFYPDSDCLEKQYDFVTCTEAFEHFYDPGKEMETLYQLIKPGGLLLLMTEKRKDLPNFEKWGYRTDNTHVCFLNDKTVEWISRAWNYEVIFSERRISLFRKNEST